LDLSGWLVGYDQRRDLHRLHNDRTPIGQRGKATQKRTEWDCIRDMVHTPVHAFWLNQIEIYFSIIQRKVLLPNNFT